MDVVYYVREGERNEELRYSLRSLRNLPHDDVWIVGHKPSWVRDVRYIRGNVETRGPSHRALGNLSRACDGVPWDRFAIFNDDFYVMEPLTAVPSLHAGPLSGRIAQAAGSYKRQLETAYALMSGWGMGLLAWTLHIPLVVTKHRLAQAIAVCRVTSEAKRVLPEWRTVYGNLWSVPGDMAEDVKVRTRRDPIPSGPFLSSSDQSWPLVRGLLAARFPDPSPYEAAT